MQRECSSDDQRKLVQCWLINPEGQGRYRFVELENFRLWEYLVTHKHGMLVKIVSVRLWLPEIIFRRYENIYSHAGEAAAIDRVSIERYDPNFRFYNTIHRFCLAEETQTLIHHLKRHLTERGIGVKDWGLETMSGVGIEPFVDELVEPVALGLA